MFLEFKLSKLSEKIKSIFTKENIKAGLKETLDTIVFVVIMVIVIRFFLGEIRWIPSASMHPTLLEGDRLFIERVTHFYKAPQRGDILVFYPPQEELKKDVVSIFARLTGFFCKDIAFIKRVIGLPGDKISVKTLPDGSSHVYVNDEPLNEPYVKDVFDLGYPCNSRAAYCKEVIVPENSYFMMGDNRGNSEDSRYWGFLPKDRIIGRAVLLFWPVNRFKYFPRYKYVKE